MRTLFILVFYFFIISGTTAQPGFSKWFDFGVAANFHNVLLKDDTLILVGSSMDLQANQWGALFVKMDTNGVVLNYRLHVDNHGGQFAFDQGYPLINTSDGGYLLAGKVHNRDSYFIYKLDSDGNIEFFKEYYEPAGVLTILPKQLMAVETGYLIGSSRQLQDGSTDAQITKINAAGEMLWEEAYGAFTKSENIGSFWKEDENTIIIGGIKSTNENVQFPSPLKCQTNWIFAIDSLGSVKWQWQSEPCEGTNTRGLHRTADGGWVFATMHLVAYNQWNWGAAPKFVKRDSQFNLLWERQVAESYWEANEMINIQPTPDGNWVGTGSWVLPEPYTPLLSGDHFYSPGCLYKLDEQGNKIWVRCDTVVLANGHPTYYNRHGGVIVLPSGSMIAAGGFNEEIGNIGKSWAWVVKVNGQGCMEEPCLTTGAAEADKPGDDHLCRIYPNPTGGILHLEAAAEINAIRVCLKNG